MIGRAAIVIAAVFTTVNGVDAAEFVPPWLCDIDYDRLIEHYKGAQATGANVPVTIIETRDRKTGGYYPDAAQAMFKGKTLTPRSGELGNSDHAKIVGGFFFGTPPGGSSWRSAAPGINTIDLYSPQSWEGVDFLAPGTVPPLISRNKSRVASFAYGAKSDLDRLTRMDWVVSADDYVLVVGSHLVSTHGNGFNTISVAPAGGVTGTAVDGTAAVGEGTPYVAGRRKPDITGPHGTSSDCIGVVGGVAALLISKGSSDVTRSNHSYLARPGYTVRSADTSEVVKAALMAGASRNTTGNKSFRDLTDYRTEPAYRTINGLDERYGAGMVNVFNSYCIIDAGEHDSGEDGDRSSIGPSGFDYNPAFGGTAQTRDTASYRFIAAAPGNLAVTLAWNVNVAGASSAATQPAAFDGTATLYNLDLKLVDLTRDANIVARSASTVDNTENLWADLEAGHAYEVIVECAAGQAPFQWDYGLAWRSEGAFVPAPVASPTLALFRPSAPSASRPTTNPARSDTIQP